MNPIGFFCNKFEEPDVAVRRLGGAGTVYTNINDAQPSNNYFIKFTNGKTLRRNINKIINAKFRIGNNTTGIDSISKQDLIKKYNKLL